MKESEYIKTKNLTKLRIVEHLLRNVLPGERWGVDEEGLGLAVLAVESMIDRLESKKLVAVDDSK